MSSKLDNLSAFVEGIYNKDNVKELYQKYLSDIQTIIPQELFEIMTKYMNQGREPHQIVGGVGKLVNVFHNALKDYRWDKPDENTFLYSLMAENRALVSILDDFKVVIKEGDYLADMDAIKSFIGQVGDYNKQLIKLENILFPNMEKKDEKYEGLKIMWSLHDEVRRQIKALSHYLENEVFEEDNFNVAIGQLFFKLYGLVEKQDMILFPCASDLFTEEEWLLMYAQSFEYGFAYIDEPIMPEVDVKALLYKDNQQSGNQSGNQTGQSLIKTSTGALSFEQMEWMMNHLPVDITFVDAEDKVVYFSNPKDRIFPRSVAVVGRDVRNCHPSDSVERVVKILDDFRNGISDTESFWIQMKGLFILIQYYAVRTDDGDYLGTLEVSQEISGGIKALEGEKRL